MLLQIKVRAEPNYSCLIRKRTWLWPIIKVRSYLHTYNLILTWTGRRFGLTRRNPGGVEWVLYKYWWEREWHLQQNNKNIIYIYTYIYIYLTSYNILVGDMSCDGEDFMGTRHDALGIGTVYLWEEGVF